MFQEKETLDGKPYKAKYSHAIASITTNVYPKNEIEDYAYQKRTLSEEYTYDYNPARTVATHAIFMTDDTDNFGLSVAIGNAFGMDATINLIGNLYVTGAITNFENPQGQIIVQQRLLDGNPVGLSLGATFLKNYHYVDIDGVDCSFCFSSEEFYTASAGIRAVLSLSAPSSYETSRPFLYATGSFNYDFNMDIYYPKIGIALGIY